MTSVSDRPDSLARADPCNSAYWLIVGGGGFSPEVLTTRLPDEERALVVFGFREEGEMYLRLEPGLKEGSWKLHHSGVEELLGVLWGLCAGVRYVVMDPLPENLPERVSGNAPVMGRQQFMEFVMGRKSPEGSEQPGV